MPHDPLYDIDPLDFPGLIPVPFGPAPGYRPPGSPSGPMPPPRRRASHRGASRSAPTPAPSCLSLQAGVRPTRRGGPRPGSGAPRGNLNALKHGRTSRQYQRLVELLSAQPEAREALIRIARRNRRRQQAARDQLNSLLTAALLRIGAALFAAQNNQTQRRPDSTKNPKKALHRENNQLPDTIRRTQSNVRGRGERRVAACALSTVPSPPAPAP